MGRQALYRSAWIRASAVLAAAVAAALLVVVLSVARWRMRALSQVEHWQRACQAGDAPSCQQLGWEYEQGTRVAQDMDTAQRLYQRSCDRGYALGCFFAGTLQEGAGQRTRAQDSYRRACQGGAAAGCTSLKRLSGSHR